MSVTVLDTPPRPAETTRATVLFVDLRGYTALAEQLSPAHVVPLLTEFYGVLERATASQGGQIFHLAGDGMMAGFGVCDARHDGARQAFDAGLAMLQRFAPLANRWRSELQLNTAIGIGLHLGDVALGCFGPPGQQSTTLVGDTVNVAARLCGRARGGEVLFTARIASALDANGAVRPVPPGGMPFLQLSQFELRGRRAPLDIWCVPASERFML